MQPLAALYRLALDVESAGRSFDHPLLAVGFCFGGEQKVVEKRLWKISMLEGWTFEPRCKAEFWDKHPERLAALQSGAQSPSRVAAEISVYLADLVARFEPDGVRRIEIVSDNPAFDVAKLDYFLYTNTVHRAGEYVPFRYFGDRYRNVVDPSERIEAFEAWQGYERWRPAGVGHDHSPENDAEDIFFQMVYADELTKNARQDPR